MTKQEALDKKIALTIELNTIEAGGPFPALYASKESAMYEYQRTIEHIDTRLKQITEEEKKEAIRNLAAVEADEKKRVMLRGIIEQLPAEWKAEIGEDTYDGPFIKGVGVSLSLKNIYSNASRFSRGYATGTKLVASTNFESRGFPKKKDGTFNIDKAVAFVKEQQQAVAARENKYASDAQKLERFKTLVKPFCKYGVYSTKQDWGVSDNFSLKVERAYGEEEKYTVWRTTSETVTAEQLTQILNNEVGLVIKEEVSS